MTWWLPHVPTFFGGRVQFTQGEMLAVLRGLPDNHFDSVVCDPPYHLTSIVSRFSATSMDDETQTSDRTRKRADGFARLAGGFMGRAWDGGDVAFRVETWAEVLRVLKPGGYILAFSSSRTFGRMSVAIEDAGFVTHPMIGWIFGQGFPKAHNLSKQLDKDAGAERKVVAQGAPVKRMIPGADQNATGAWIKDNGREYVPTKTEAATDAARQWDGWAYGAQSLKPALEPIYMGQKPFSEATGSKNVMRWGVGAVNVDGCRVGDFVNTTPPGTDRYNRANFEHGYRPSSYGREGEASAETRYADRGSTNFAALPGPRGGAPEGRWPANLLHDGSDEVIAAFPDSAGQLAYVGPEHGDRDSINTYGDYGARPPTPPRSDSGSAARFFASCPPEEGDKFFYCAKAPSSERAGSSHPTVKPLSLMRYLTRLVTPPNGLVLDPFAGSGTTGEAAALEGFRAFLIDMSEDTARDLRARESR